MAEKALRRRNPVLEVTASNDEKGVHKSGRNFLVARGVPQVLETNLNSKTLGAYESIHTATNLKI